MANKTYLVKKDPLSNLDNPEWIYMDGEQFHKFTHSPEGKGRYFIHLLDDISYEADEIYIEASYEKYRAWKQEHNHHQYLIHYMEKNRPLSIDVPIGEAGEPLVDILADKSAPLDEAFAERDERERLARIISEIQPEEQQLLDVMYLSGKNRTEAETAKMLGVSRDVVKRRKKKIFSKIKKLLRPKS